MTYYCFASKPPVEPLSPKVLADLNDRLGLDFKVIAAAVRANPFEYFKEVL